MVWLYPALFLTLVLGYVTAAGPDRRGVPVFLDQKEASEVISRQKRANAGDEENKLPPNLERECLEEVCNYEEAREVFQDAYRTDIFWSVYIDGDQCANQPCKNGAMCSDSVGGYDCICKSGFSGVHCETDQTVCIPDKDSSCTQFCKPGYQSYECSCAWGWKLELKKKCVPAVQYPCGQVSSLSQWESRQSSNVRSGYEGLDCNTAECPWQAVLRNTGSSAFCSGVIVKDNFVLTTAQCVNKHKILSVAVGKRVTPYENSEQNLAVKQVHIHPRYLEGKAENDLALLELKSHIHFKGSVVAACLPERDFADSVLMSGKYMGAVTGWKEASELQGNLRLNHLSYSKLQDCVERHSGQVTNKMACTQPRPKADCFFSSGSPILTVYKQVFFLTGVVSQHEAMDCSKGYVFQKVSRFLPWLKSVMGSV